MNFLFPLSLLLLAQPEAQTKAQTKAQTETQTKAPTKAQPEAQTETQTEQPGAHFSRQFWVLPRASPEQSEGPVGHLVKYSTKPKATVPLLGVRLDVGFPDGIGLDFLGHPLPFLQLHFGLMTNFLGVGVRGGANYIPWRNIWGGVFRPVFTFEVGHHFNGATWYLSQNTSSGDRDFYSSIQYTFINNFVGFDVGSANVAFTFRFGGSFLFFKSAGIPPVRIAPGEFYIKKIKAQMLLPSVKLGISVCFL